MTCSAAAAAPPPSSSRRDDAPPPGARAAPASARPRWESLAGCDVVTLPSAAPPVAIVRFTGGLGAGAAPRALYGRFLEDVARRGDVAVVAAPLRASFDHAALAADAADRLGEATRLLAARWDLPWVPSFGMGHSLGAKVQVLANCDERCRRAQGPVVANMLLSFNNFSAGQSIPMWDSIRAGLEQQGAGQAAKELDKVADFLKRLDLSGFADARGLEAVNRASDVLRRVGDTINTVSGSVGNGEFTPTPEEMLRLVEDKYSVPENLLISYTRDTLDQSAALQEVLQTRFAARGAVVRKLEGTHVTPLTPSIERDGKFASTGSREVDDTIRRTASGVARELDATVAVIVAFLRLHLEVLASKRMLPRS